MASLTKVHGKAEVFYAGKEVALTSLIRKQT